MRHTIIPREQAAANLAVSPEVLIRYESKGLIRTVREGNVEGYEPVEIRRIWSIVSFQRDLGINLAGVEAILRLREQMDELQHRVQQFALDLRSALDEGNSAEEPTDAP